MAERIETTLVDVLEAVIEKLRYDLALNERTCFLWIDRGDGTLPPIPHNLAVTVEPDAASFPADMWRGGGEHQATVETNVVITVHSLVQLDSGNRDELALLKANRGALDLLGQIVVSLADHDLLVGAGNDTCLRELMAPQGFSAPSRTNAEGHERRVQMSIVWPISFDWKIDHSILPYNSTTSSTTTTSGP